MNTNEKFWMVAKRAAYQVDFLRNARELLLYTQAIYSAMIWGWGEKAEEMERENTLREKLLK